MSKEKVAIILLIGILLIAVAIADLDSKDLDAICDKDNNFLYRFSGIWGCGSINTSEMNITITYNTTNITYHNLNETDPIWSTQKIDYTLEARTDNLNSTITENENRLNSIGNWTQANLSIPSCSNPLNDKLMWNTTDTAFYCGADQTGGSGGIPYTGATENVDLNGKEITNVTTLKARYIEVNETTGSTEGLRIYGNSSEYFELNLQNTNNGTNSSGDIVVTANNGNDTTYYIDLGINNAAYNNALYKVTGANDGYLYTSNGNIAIGTAKENKSVIFHTDGTGTGNEVMRIKNKWVGIGTTEPIGMLDIGNGIISASMNKGIVNIGGYYNSPILRYGISSNNLLRTETFGTTWVARNTTAALGADTTISPTGVQNAEWALGNDTNSVVRQIITNATTGNWTFSVWLRSDNTTPTIGLRIDLNDTSIGTVKNLTISNQWKRYYVTREVTETHTNKTVNILINRQNTSMWGAQLENADYPGIYNVPRTTTALPAKTATFYTPYAIQTAGSITAVGVAVGGALSGATSGAFSTTVRITGITTLGNSLIQNKATGYTSEIGIQQYNTIQPTIGLPIQQTPSNIQRGMVWNGTMARDYYLKQESIGFGGTNTTAMMTWEYAINSSNHNNYSRIMSLESEGILTVMGDERGVQILNNPSLTGNGLNWTTNGGFNLTNISNTASMNFSRGATGNLIQTNTNWTTGAVKPNKWYVLNYSTSGIVAGCEAYINETTTSKKRTFLKGISVAQTVNTTYKTQFQTNNNPTSLTITAICSAGGFRMNNITLTEMIGGNIVANGEFTGGGGSGIKINETGSITIRNLTSPSGGYVCADPNGILYVNTTCP